jgi:hypothetical protein
LPRKAEGWDPDRGTGRVRTPFYCSGDGVAGAASPSSCRFSSMILDQ